jgi:hypothetical protein
MVVKKWQKQDFWPGIWPLDKPSSKIGPSWPASFGVSPPQDIKMYREREIVSIFEPPIKIGSYG